MLCMLMLMLIILCHFHGEANLAIEDLSPLPGVVTTFLLYTWGQPCGRRLVNRYRGPSCYYLSCLSHPAVGDLSIATGGRHVIFHYAYEANPCSRRLAITTEDRHMWFSFRFITHAMFMLMLTKLELLYIHIPHHEHRRILP